MTKRDAYRTAKQTAHRPVMEAMRRSIFLPEESMLYCCSLQTINAPGIHLAKANASQFRLHYVSYEKRTIYQKAEEGADQQKDQQAGDGNFNICRAS